jgi:hypothetical protein
MGETDPAFFLFAWGSERTTQRASPSIFSAPRLDPDNRELSSPSSQKPDPR